MSLLFERILLFASDARSLGVWNTILLKTCSRFPYRENRFWKVRHPEAQYPLGLRPGTTDAAVFRSTFIETQYSNSLDSSVEPSLIVDCGANAGFTAAAFLSRFPKARVIAVEPDESNFALCRENLLPYGERAVAVRAGVWGRCATLTIEPGSDWAKYAIRVREAKPGESGINALDMNALLELSHADCIDLLKIDIEGSEISVFAEPSCHEWLPKVRNIAIELHGPECEQAMLRAMSRYAFDIDRQGEITNLRNIRPLG